jgi:glycosyltransferase involved in cell wall biosynthesis
MVMIESMACGTPVIGFGRGSVPEVIRDGVTGFVVKNKEDMINAIEKVEFIDRQQCCNFALECFDVSIIASKYLKLIK